MVNLSSKKSALLLSSACALLLPATLMAETLAFKLSGITDRNARFTKVDLYEDGNPQYYTSRDGEALRFDAKRGVLVPIQSLPASAGGTGYPIAKSGSQRPDPLFLAGSPNADGANGVRAGAVHLVNLATGPSAGGIEGQALYGSSPYSRLGREILQLGEAESSGPNNSTILSSYFAVSEDRSPLYSTGSRIRILQVGRNEHSTQPIVANSCNIDLRRMSSSKPFLMTPVEDQTGDGIQELFVVASTCSLQSGSNCPYSYARVHIFDPTRCEELAPYEWSIPYSNENMALRSIVDLGDFRGNGNQHVGVAVLPAGYQQTPKLHIFEIRGGALGEQGVTHVHTINGPDQSFGFDMAYNGETLAVSSPQSDYYPNVSSEEGVIHLIDRGVFHIRESFGGGGKREMQIGGALQWIERGQEQLLVSTALTAGITKMDFFATDSEQFALSGTACTDFRSETAPTTHINVEFNGTTNTIDFLVSGLDTGSRSQSFLFLDGINSGRSQPYFRSWGQSCETTVRFSELISSPQLAVDSSGTAEFSLDYIPGTILYGQERDLTALVVTISFDSNGYPHMKTSEELHFNLP